MTGAERRPLTEWGVVVGCNGFPDGYTHNRSAQGSTSRGMKEASWITTNRQRAASIEPATSASAFVWLLPFGVARWQLMR